MHKNLGRTPGSERSSTVLTENIFFLLEMFTSFIILTWFQMYKRKSTIPSYRFSHCYCWQNFKISHRKHWPLADTRVNFERPAQVSISGDCIAITWRHLIFFCFFTAPAEGWINGAFHSDDNHAVFPIMTTVTAPQLQPADWKLSVESHAVTHRLTLPEVGDPRIIAQHWQLDLWNWEHISQTHRIHLDCGACHWVLQKFSAAEWHPAL